MSGQKSKKIVVEKHTKNASLRDVLLEEMIARQLQKYPQLVDDLIEDFRRGLDESSEDLDDAIREYSNNFFFGPSNFDFGSSCIPDVIADLLDAELVAKIRKAYLADKRKSTGH